MTYTVPPAANPPASQAVSHPAAAVPAAPPLAPSGPPVARAEQEHTPAPDVSAPVEPGPVSVSAPAPLPEPVEVQYSPISAPAPAVEEKIALGSGIQPETVVGAEQKAAARAPKSPAAVPSPMGPPIAQAEIYEVGQIVGGVAAPPVVALAPGSPTVHRDTVYSISDTVRSYAEKNGVNLSTVTPTGKGGRIVKKDVDSAIAAAVLASAQQVPFDGDFTTAEDEHSDGDEPATDADILPFARTTAPAVTAVPPRSMADDDDSDDDSDDDEDAAEGGVGDGAVETSATAAVPAEEIVEPVAEVAADPVMERPAEQLVESAAEPAMERPAEQVVDLPTPAPAATETATLRIPVALGTGPVVVPSPQELTAKAQALLPGFAVLNAYVEISTSGPVLVVGVATTLTLEVTL